MTKKDIVKSISEKINMTQLMTKEIVQETFDTIVETLVREGRIELRNFGVFEAKKRAARRARNPRTSERVDVPAKIVVTFKPGKKMEEMVRNMDPEVLAGGMTAQGDPPAAAVTSFDPSPPMEAPAADNPTEGHVNPPSQSGLDQDTETEI